MSNTAGIEEQLKDALARGDREETLAAARELLSSAIDSGDGQLVEARSRLVELGRLVAEMAHELRQPLLGVKAFAQMLEGRAEDAEYVARKAADIVTHARRMEEIVERVLRYARREPQNITRGRTDVNATLVGATGLLAHALRRARVSVESDLDPGIPSVALDDVSLQQVFVNLIANARDSMADLGGVIEVATRPCETGVEIMVSDSGPGVAGPMRARVFDAFVTSRDHGTGLGLYVSRRIVERGGGSIALVGDDGSTFRVLLPAAEDV